MKVILTIFIAAIAASTGYAWISAPSKRHSCTRLNSSKVNFKHAFPVFIIATSAVLFTPPNAFARIDALDGALKAMSDGSEKEQGKEREFSSLTSVASKKRYALNLCKDSSLYKTAGYSGASECSSDVLNGNFQTIVDVSLGKESVAPKMNPVETQKKTIEVKAMPVMSKSQLAAAQAAKNPNLAATKESAAVPNRKKEVIAAKKEKVQDLSDLSPAQKKRRAIAGCKNADTRKMAKMGSADKCTSRVMAGDLAPMIEALEYGY